VINYVFSTMHFFLLNNPVKSLSKSLCWAASANWWDCTFPVAWTAH